MLTSACSGGGAPPRPPAAASAALTTRVYTAVPMAASQPTSLSIPALGAHAAVMPLGLNADRTLQVPPIEANSPAGWYKYSPTPGQLGPSVIVGHVAVGRFGNGVFFKLATLQAGAEIDVTRADGSVAVFSATNIGTYPKQSFPTAMVYGNLSYPGLRLITCGGALDPATDSYPDNIIVSAVLVASRGPG